MNYQRYSEDDYDQGGGGPGGTGDSGKMNVDLDVCEGVIMSLNPISWQSTSNNEPGEQHEDGNVSEQQGVVGSKAIKGPQFAACNWEPRRPEARVKRRRRIPSHGAGPLEQEVFTYLARDESLRRQTQKHGAARRTALKQVMVNGARTWQSGVTKARPVFHGRASWRGPPQAVSRSPTSSRPQILLARNLTKADKAQFRQEGHRPRWRPSAPTWSESQPRWRTRTRSVDLWPTQRWMWSTGWSPHHNGIRRRGHFGQTTPTTSGRCA